MEKLRNLQHRHGIPRTHSASIPSAPFSNTSVTQTPNKVVPLHNNAMNTPSTPTNLSIADIKQRIARTTTGIF